MASGSVAVGARRKRVNLALLRFTSLPPNWVRSFGYATAVRPAVPGVSAGSAGLLSEKVSRGQLRLSCPLSNTSQSTATLSSR